MKLSATCAMLSLLVVMLSLLQFLGVPLKLAPGDFSPWTLLTCGLLVTNITVLLTVGSYFEQRWGRRTFLFTLLFVSSATNFISALSIILNYAWTRNEDLISIGTNGLGGFLCGLVVAYKQVIPEHVINVFKRPVIRVKYTPSLIILLHLILFLVGLINITFYMHTSGIVITWIYLRYFKFYNGVRGDRSETFSFASFFPDSFHKSLKPISTATYTFLVKYSLLPALPPRATQTMEQMEMGQEPQETSDSARRKALATKELEERLAQT